MWKLEVSFAGPDRIESSVKVEMSDFDLWELCKIFDDFYKTQWAIQSP